MYSKGINAKYISPRVSRFYPIPFPETDQPIRNTIVKWRELVFRRGFCPFTHTFGSKYSIEVERSNKACDWIKHAHNLVENSEIDSSLLVLPLLDLPEIEYAKHIFKTFSPERINNGLFGSQLEEFQILMEESNIRADRKVYIITVFGNEIALKSDKILLEVPFHPYSTNNWSPYPIIHLIKESTMFDAQEWYKTNYNTSVSKIVDDNDDKRKVMENDDNEKLKFNLEKFLCYLDIE